MKVLQVEEYFDTDAGYQINEMIRVWPQEHELVIITTKIMSVFHKEYDEVQIVKDLEFESKYNVKLIRLDVHFKVGSRVFYKGLKKVIKLQDPDVLFLHGIGDFKDLLFVYGNNDYLTFRDCHMSWVASKNKYASIYYKFFKVFFSMLINRFKIYEKVYALGYEEVEYIKALGISKDRIELLPHGYNRTVYFNDSSLREKRRKELQVSEDEILISYIGKFDSSKEPDLNLNIFDSLSYDFIERNKLKFLFLGPKEDVYMNNVFNDKMKGFKYKDKCIVLSGRRADELVDDYNASDICMWPKETTLSSIHAQVCGARVIMEKYESNKERVVTPDDLFEIGNLDNAKEVLIRIVEEVVGNTGSIDVKSLENREYHNQIPALLASWETMLLNKNRRL